MKALPEYVSFLKENRTIRQAQTIYNQRISDSEEVFEKFSAEFYNRPCPFCGHDDFHELPKFHNMYGVVKCNTCASMYVNPTPSLEALNYYYNECKCNQHLGQILKSRVGKRGVILSERTEFVVIKIKKLLEFKNQIRILEVGCHSGAFLAELSEVLSDLGLLNAVEMIGIDIEKSAISSPVSDDLNLIHSSVEDFVKSRHENFDLIMHFELIEHLHDPFRFCQDLKELLSDRGLMYFHTPNALGLDNKALGYNDFRPIAHAIFPPMHLNAFTTQNVGQFLLRVGLKVKEVSTPGNFDVDIVRQFVKNYDNDFSIVNRISAEKELAILQKLISLVNGSSHLAVLAEK